MVEQSCKFEFYFERYAGEVNFELYIEQDADEFDSLVLSYMLDKQILLNKSFGKVSPEEALLIEKLVQESLGKTSAS